MDTASVRRAKVNLAHALGERGWKLYGFHPECTPPFWEGLAEKDGYILVVAYTGIPFTPPYPGLNQTILPNPRRKTWHIQKDGRIIAGGTGLKACQTFADFEPWQAAAHEKTLALARSIEKAVQEHKSRQKREKGDGRVKVGEYKGHPVISLPLGENGYHFTFGLAKAGAILAHITDIERFVQDGGGQYSAGVETGEYKGHPVISLPLNNGRFFTFGRSKAKAILKHRRDIEAFVSAHSG